MIEKNSSLKDKIRKMKEDAEAAERKAAEDKEKVGNENKEK